MTPPPRRDRRFLPHFGHISVATSYGKNGEYMWSALHAAQPAGTSIELLEDDGTLAIVNPSKTPNGARSIAWTSVKGEVAAGK